MDLKTLERMTVPKLREEALKIPELSGVRGMNKEDLIRAIAIAHKIDLSTRRRGGSGKSALKKQIRELRARITEAIRTKQTADLKKLRRHVKHLKAQTRRLAKARISPQAEAGASIPPPTAS
ncbi:MAG TPA: hypothetical protein VLF14_10180 [Candidatus Binatia bacterium]|nr:hypothetical protein [Candidatus Binatia bacterium]